MELLLVLLTVRKPCQALVLLLFMGQNPFQRPPLKQTRWNKYSTTSNVRGSNLKTENKSSTLQLPVSAIIVVRCQAIIGRHYRNASVLSEVWVALGLKYIIVGIFVDGTGNGGKHTEWNVAICRQELAPRLYKRQAKEQSVSGAGISYCAKCQWYMTFEI